MSILMYMQLHLQQSTCPQEPRPKDESDRVLTELRNQQMVRLLCKLLTFYSL